jgi:recombination protein RecR
VRVPFPTPIQALVDQFAKFPGIGEKTAQRFAFYLLRLPNQDLLRLAKLIMNLHDSILVCGTCQSFSDRNPCALCSNISRDHSMLCVVSQSNDIVSFERTGEYRGVYHVLGGTINILEGTTPDKLKVKELVERILDQHRKISEVILAFNPDLEGESTALYLSKLLRSYPIKITRLARGLPRGADIDYADEVTLGDALKSRREI